MGFSAVTGGTPRKIHSIYASSFRHVLRGREAVLRCIIHEVGPVAVLVPERRCEIFLGNWDVNLWDFFYIFLNCSNRLINNICQPFFII